MSTNAEISVINLNVFQHAPFPNDSSFPSLEQKRVAKTIDTALRNNGCFILQNFGLPDDLLRDMFSVSAKLFAPSMEEKKKTLPLNQRLSLENPNTGYLPPGSEMLNSTRGMTAESKESFNVRFCSHMNQDFSGCPSQFQSIASKFWSTITQKSVPLISIALALALELPVDFFENLLESGNNSMIRSLHYPSISSSSSKSDKLTIRAGEHTDFGIFTLLFTDSPGLQAQPISGGDLKDGALSELQNSNWLDVPVPPFGNAIVNVGAMTARITNDRWPALAHRVVDKNINRSRYSIACFMEPMEYKSLKVHPKFISESDGILNYKGEITAGEYITKRLKGLDPK